MTNHHVVQGPLDVFLGIGVLMAMLLYSVISAIREEIKQAAQESTVPHD